MGAGSSDRADETTCSSASSVPGSETILIEPNNPAVILSKRWVESASSPAVGMQGWEACVTAARKHLSV